MIRRFFVVAVALAIAGTVQARQKPANVAGTWEMTVETNAGSGTPTFTFTQDGEKLTGTYKGQFGEAKVTGTVKGNEVSWTFNVDAQGVAAEMKYEGTVDKDTMKGKVDLGGLAEGTFTGKRK